MITLLNGEQWEEADILKRMEDDSFYYGHLGKHALSSSSLKKLLESPNAYKASLRRSDSSQNLRDGRLVHLCILEPHRIQDLTIINGTKAKKEFKDATEELGEHLVYTESELNNAYWVANAIKDNNEATFLLEGCDMEVSGVGEINGVPFRAKADALCKITGKIVDLKTTSKPVSEFYSSARFFKYNLQAALYMHIFGASEFTFLVVNKETKDIGIFECSEEFLEAGWLLVEEAIDIYKRFFMSEDSDDLIKNNVIRGIL